MAGVLAAVRMEGRDQRQGETHKREPKLTGSDYRHIWEKQSQEPQAETKEKHHGRQTERMEKKQRLE